MTSVHEMTSIGADAYLPHLVEHGGYALLERSIGRGGSLKRDMVSLKGPDGRDLGLRTARGFDSRAIELPIDTFNDYVRAGFLAQDGPHDVEGGTVFRVTPKGIAACRGR